MNSNSEVVGIAFASLSEGQNLNFAIPVKYLQDLKMKMTTSQPVSNIKIQTSGTTSTGSMSNITAGVLARNIQIENDGVPGYPHHIVSFSIKNDLQYAVTNIAVLILIYDNTGTVVDYIDAVYFKTHESYGTTYTDRGQNLTDDYGIRPNLARTFTEDIDAAYKVGYKVKIRILDFRILEK